MPTDGEMSAGLLAAASEYLRNDAPGLWAGWKGSPVDRSGRRAVRADIASGDQVIADASARARVLARVPTAVAVEMEGAAVAQVCLEHGVAFACVRTLSDAADERITASFPEFLSGPAAAYSAGIIRRWLGA